MYFLILLRTVVVGRARAPCVPGSSRAVCVLQVRARARPLPPKAKNLGFFLFFFITFAERIFTRTHAHTRSGRRTWYQHGPTTGRERERVYECVCVREWGSRRRRTIFIGPRARWCDRPKYDRWKRRWDCSYCPGRFIANGGCGGADGDGREKLRTK